MGQRKKYFAAPFVKVFYLFSSCHPFRRGLCLIFENDMFHTGLGLSKRKGSNVDRGLMVDVFSKLQFEVLRTNCLDISCYKKFHSQKKGTGICRTFHNSLLLFSVQYTA